MDYEGWDDIDFESDFANTPFDDDDRAFGAFIDAENGMNDWLFVDDDPEDWRLTAKDFGVDIDPVEAFQWYADDVYDYDIDF